MFAAYGFGQGFFGEGPLQQISLVAGPITVTGLTHGCPDITLSGETPSVADLHDDGPSISDLEEL